MATGPFHTKRPAILRPSAEHAVYNHARKSHLTLPAGNPVGAVDWNDEKRRDTDWTRHQTAAPFRRNDQMLAVMPIGIVVFPGSGIIDNLADKARALGHLLAGRVATETAWPRLTIPSRLRSQFAGKLMDRRSRACFDASYPDEDGDLREWDAEIFTRLRRGRWSSSNRTFGFVVGFAT